MPMSNELPVNVRAMPSAFVGLLAMPSVVLALSLATMRIDPLGGGVLTLLSGCGLVFLYVWLQAFALSVDSTWLSGRSLGKSWRVEIADIASAEVVRVPLRQRGLGRGPKELKICLVRSEARHTLNVSVFRPGDLKSVLGCIPAAKGGESPQAR